MPNHSPAPWRIVNGLGIVDRDGSTVADLTVAQTFHRDTVVAANARLLAAAPDLLDLLRRLLDWERQPGGWEAPVWEAARAVVSRVDGRAA